MSRQARPLGGGVRPAPRTSFESNPAPARRGRYDSEASQPAPSRRARSSSRYRGDDDRGDTMTYRNSPPSLPSSPRTKQSFPSSTRRPPVRNSGDSISSVSSSGSSIVERMSARSAASSRTSLEEDAPRAKPRRAWLSAAPAAAPEPEEEYIDEQPEEQEAPRSDAGSSLWGRVVAAAGSLSVNVSKAIETNITRYDGEETPSGGESRISVALKQYYISRAQSAADLPEWLFDATERRAMGGSSAPESRSRSSREDPPPTSRITPTASGTRTPTAPPARRVLQDAPVQSKASNRLRELREARRGPAAAPVAEAQSYDSNQRYDDRGETSAQEQRRRTPAARVGLPSGPGRVRR